MSKLLVSSAIILGFTTMSSLADKNKLVEVVEGSIITFTCPSCPKEEDDKDKGIELVRGSQVFEMRKVGDEEKLFRTENWLGGSPVSFVHIAPESKEQAVVDTGEDITGEDKINIVSPAPLEGVPAPIEGVNENEISAIDEKPEMDSVIDQDRSLLPEVTKAQSAADAASITSSETDIKLRPNISADKLTSIADDAGIKDTKIKEPVAVMKALPLSETPKVEDSVPVSQ